MARNPIGSTRSFSTWTIIIQHYICDLFFIIEGCDIANYADDNTSYLSGKNVEEVLNGLENSNVNEVIRAVFNSLFFFYKKILHAQKHSQAKSTDKTKIN